MIRLSREESETGAGGRLLPKTAVLSFTLGLLALRVCWLPGVNCALALAAVAAGAVALVRIAHGDHTKGEMDEAITGVVLGMVVLGLSSVFVSALVAAYR